MYKLALVVLSVHAVFLQHALGHCSAPAAWAHAPPGAPAWAPPPPPCGHGAGHGAGYGGQGTGEFSAQGEVAISEGSTVISGSLPAAGVLQFEGPVPASGVVYVVGSTPPLCPRGCPCAAYNK